MTYNEATEYLFNSAPLFQNIGAGAYKEGLENTHTLDEHFGHPHTKFRTIHVGGTNGKGSVSHTLAAILQAQGLKVGLYTSPHLVDFRERIRVNGEMIPEENVIKFVEDERYFFEPLHPSFFELATAMAFQYFAEQKIDVTVVEVGLGGRLDCTNIIRPELSIITNISFDHVQFLGDTLEKIASEKAGIIKSGVPVIIGESVSDSVSNVFRNKALSVGAPICFADKLNEVTKVNHDYVKGYEYDTRDYGSIHGELRGYCQEKNTRTILAAITQLNIYGWNIKPEAVRHGFSNVCNMTGLMGRWQILENKPLTICDTGHNVGGISYIVKQLKETPHEQLHIIIGMVSDKDISTVLTLLPKDARYYFTQASVKRAMAAETVAKMAHDHGLCGNAYENVESAYLAAKKFAQNNDLIYIGGSTFVVADMLNSRL